MSILPQLYVPTAVEIQTVAASAKRRHPALAGRIDKAAEILASGSLQLDPIAWDKCQVARWRIASQSGNGSYVVTSGTCPCQDKRTQWCKHAIATQLYSKVVTNNLNVDIRGREIDLGILPDGSFNCYAKGLGVVHLRKVGPAYIFADAASMVRYSIWLAKRSVNWAAPKPTLVWAGHSVTLAAA